MQKKLIELVKDFGAWQGNSFTLAAQAAEVAKEEAALIAEAAGQQEVADAIRRM